MFQCVSCLGGQFRRLSGGLPVRCRGAIANGFFSGIVFIASHFACNGNRIPLESLRRALRSRLLSKAVRLDKITRLPNQLRTQRQMTAVFHQLTIP